MDENDSTKIFDELADIKKEIETINLRIDYLENKININTGSPEITQKTITRKIPEPLVKKQEEKVGFEENIGKNGSAALELYRYSSG